MILVTEPAFGPLAQRLSSAYVLGDGWVTAAVHAFFFLNSSPLDCIDFVSSFDRHILTDVSSTVLPCWVCVLWVSQRPSFIGGGSNSSAPAIPLTTDTTAANKTGLKLMCIPIG